MLIGPKDFSLRYFLLIFSLFKQSLCYLWKNRFSRSYECWKKSFNFPLFITVYSHNLKTSLCIKEKFLSLFRNKMLTGNLPRRQLFCKFLCFRPMAIDYAAITKWKMSWFIIVKKSKAYSILISFQETQENKLFLRHLNSTHMDAIWVVV